MTVARAHARVAPWGGNVVEDLDIPQNRLAESAERVTDRAVEEAHRREHPLLMNEHVCLAFAQVEWDFFGQIMRDNDLNPHQFVQALEEHLRLLPANGRELRVAPATKLLFKLALLHASRCGRHAIEAIDLFSAIFEETQGVPVSILRRAGSSPRRSSPAWPRVSATRRSAKSGSRSGSSCRHSSSTSPPT